MAWGFKSEGSRSVIRQDGVARVAINEDGSMELLTPAANPTGNDVPTAGQLPFTKEYVSPEQTITAGGTVTLLHGLGVLPKLVALELICKTAENGYSVNDVAPIGFFDYGGSGQSWMVGATKSASELFFRYGAQGMLLPNKTTGVGNAITPANWRLVVRAWA